MPEIFKINYLPTFSQKSSDFAITSVSIMPSSTSCPTSSRYLITVIKLFLSYFIFTKSAVKITSPWAERGDIHCRTFFRRNWISAKVGRSKKNRRRNPYTYRWIMVGETWRTLCNTSSAKYYTALGGTQCSVGKEKRSSLIRLASRETRRGLSTPRRSAP